MKGKKSKQSLKGKTLPLGTDGQRGNNEKEVQISTRTSSIRRFS